MYQRIPTVQRLTAYGKEIRKIRIEKDLTMTNMATTMNLSAACLSAMELGNKEVTPAFIKKLVKELSLSEKDAANLRKAAMQSCRVVRIKLTGAKPANRELAYVISNKIGELSEATCNRLLDLINAEEKEHAQK